MILEWVFLTLTALCIGSFINVLILRIPAAQSVVSPPSACPACENKLRWHHNIPLVSYAILRGRCGFCATPISLQYPVVELLTALLFILVFVKEGFGLPALLISVTFALLLALSMIDLKYKAVPDSLNLSALSLAIVHMPSFEPFKNALLLAGAFCLLRYYVSYALRREALGEGDIMIAGTMGALLGIQLSLAAVFLASLIALPISLYGKYKAEEPETPFVPFLALGALIAYLFESPILTYMERLGG